LVPSSGPQGDLQHGKRQKTELLMKSAETQKMHNNQPIDSPDRAWLSPELLSLIVDNLDEIIYVADIETHNILFANTYLKKLFGFNPVGKKCWQLIHRHIDGPCRFCNNFDLLDADGEPAGIIHWEYQNPFNKKWYAAKDQAIRWSDGRLVRLEIAKDITEHKELETFLDEARKQADAARNNRNRFVALVAHDLKSPFVSILGMLQRILKKETFTYAVHRQFIENIINNGQRMLNMIDNLLDMDRLETGRIKPDLSFFDVSVMVDEVLANFAIPAENKHLVLKNTVPAGTEIYADRYLYFVMLNNLVSNAVKFSYAGGAITVSFSDSAEHPQLLVADEGQGIPAQVLADIFRADVKTSRTGTMGEKGTGLGLVFCQQIMQAHGGTIQVESTEGKGTTLYVALGPSCRLPGGDDGKGIVASSP
jgi:PAS domain S-box-containing protein